MMDRIHARRATAVALLALVCGACFSERSAITEPGECSNPVQHATVEIRDFEFVPAQVCVQAGGTVTWINQGTDIHTSTSTAEPRVWDSGFLSPGEQYSRSFGSGGEFDYLCLPHPFMRGTVVVSPGGTAS